MKRLLFIMLLLVTVVACEKEAEYKDILLKDKWGITVKARIWNDINKVQFIVSAPIGYSVIAYWPHDPYDEFIAEHFDNTIPTLIYENNRAYQVYLFYFREDGSTDDYSCIFRIDSYKELIIIED